MWVECLWFCYLLFGRLLLWFVVVLELLALIVICCGFVFFMVYGKLRLHDYVWLLGICAFGRLLACCLVLNIAPGGSLAFG